MSIFCCLSFFYKQQNQERLGFYMKANNGWMDGKQDYTINMKHESHNRNILLFEGRTGGGVVTGWSQMRESIPGNSARLRVVKLVM